MTLLRRALSVWLAGMTLTMSFVPVSVAQTSSPADDFIRRQAEQNRQQRLDSLRAATLRGAQSGTATADQAPASASGPCFSVDNVAVDGVSLLQPGAINRVTAAYHGKCIGLADINALMKQLTLLYVEAGYIAARLYVPEQDIAATRTLHLVAAEGTLSDIYINGQPARQPGEVATAFPGMKGRAVNIRDVEQGIDQLNRLTSNNAKTNMLPGSAPGDTILNVENKPDQPWHFSASVSNLGQQNTGYVKSALGLRMDGLAGINDLLALNYEHSGRDRNFSQSDVGSGNSISGTYSIPYGYWTFTLNGSYYRYDSLIAGNFSDIETAGDSSQFGFSIDRVIGRDKDSITTLNSGLNYKETNNFLMGNLIEVGSRQYSVANLGISHSRRFADSMWVFDLNYSQGLGIFGAVEKGDPAAGEAEPQFSKFNATVNVSKPFALGGQNFLLGSMLNGQYSPDNLLGAEQVSFGGVSTVRGSRESLIFGNNGLFSRNELTWRTMPWAQSETLRKRLGEVRPYLAIDYGHVFAQQRFGIAGGDVAGWTVGTRLAGGSIGADIGYSRLFKNSSDNAARDLFFVSTSLQW